jgi:Putative transposase/Transposase zinc-binding domain
MYVARTPYKTDLHALVRENYRQVFFDKEVQGTQLPFHLEREFKKYLTCGIPSYGMARFQCPCCQKDKFVAFSCKGRICPSCTGRRTADTAKHLLEEVIPAVPVRQWVLSLPYVYRFLLATRPEFLRKALAVYHRTINRHYQKKATLLKLNKPKIGSVTVVQRFSSSLSLNVHFHSIYMDGVFHENYLGEEVFYEIIPTHEEVVEITGILKKRLEGLMAREENIDNVDSDLAHIQAQSVQNRDENFKLPLKIGKVWDPPFEDFKGTRCCYKDGFSLHANVKILGHLRSGLEQLCRYVLRGPLALDRISYDGDNGKVNLKLKKAYKDMTTHLQFTPEQFIKRVIALIPPPRQNLIRYIGVFGARHKKRAIITGMAQPKKEKVKKKSYRTPWAELLKHVFKYEVSKCEHCGTNLVLIATITSRHVCHKILNHLGLPIYEVNATAPRGPPELDLFDQMPEYF